MIHSHHMIFTQYDSAAVFERFRNRICPKQVDYLVYADYKECTSALNSVSTFCSDSDKTRQSIDKRRVELYRERVPWRIAPLVDRLYSSRSLEDGQIMKLQKHSGQKRYPITNDTRATVLARLKQYYPPRPKVA